MNSTELKARYDAAYDEGIPCDLGYYDDACSGVVEWIDIDGVGCHNDSLDDDLRDSYDSAYDFSMERAWRE